MVYVFVAHFSSLLVIDFCDLAYRLVISFVLSSVSICSAVVYVHASIFFWNSSHHSLAALLRADSFPDMDLMISLRALRFALLVIYSPAVS
jgi:hypothetical protein